MERLVVVAEAASPAGTFGRAVREGDRTGCGVVGDHVRFAAGVVHGLEDGECARVGLEAREHLRPGDAGVARRVLREARAQRVEEGKRRRGHCASDNGVSPWPSVNDEPTALTIAVRRVSPARSRSR